MHVKFTRVILTRHLDKRKSLPMPDILVFFYAKLAIKSGL
jgi:hypothetical protein